MMEQIVRVRRCLPDGQAEVLHLRQSACSGDCHKCSGCGAAQETLIVRASNPIGARAGDLVVLSSDSAGVLKAAAVVYLLPVILFFAGYALGAGVGRGGALGCLGFALGLAGAVVADRHHARRRKTVYTITGYAPYSEQSQS